MSAIPFRGCTANLQYSAADLTAAPLVADATRMRMRVHPPGGDARINEGTCIPARISRVTTLEDIQ